jgi:hypothetical protein
MYNCLALMEFSFITKILTSFSYSTYVYDLSPGG